MYIMVLSFWGSGSALKKIGMNVLDRLAVFELRPLAWWACDLYSPVLQCSSKVQLV
jgi:hypothetical protein